MHIQQSPDLIDALERDGFAIIPAALEPDVVLDLQQEVENSLSFPLSAGVRGLAEKIPTVRLLAQSSAIRSIVDRVLGKNAVLVRSILFTKNEQANWSVTWHQDLAIAVQSQCELEGYVSWSVKDGVPHVQPPAAVLERMLTVRLHLDPADESNGALLVSPGSHRLGRLPASAAAQAAERLGERICAVNAGDALVFRPLILHASRKATSDRARRVIHLEFASGPLPEPLAWAEAAA